MPSGDDATDSGDDATDQAAAVASSGRGEVWRGALGAFSSVDRGTSRCARGATMAGALDSALAAAAACATDAPSLPSLLSLGLSAAGSAVGAVGESLFVTTRCAGVTISLSRGNTRQDLDKW